MIAHWTLLRKLRDYLTSSVATVQRTTLQPVQMIPFLFAEAEGFEPPVPLGTPVFKTGVIDHSTKLPECLATCFWSKSAAKVMFLFHITKFLPYFIEKKHLAPFLIESTSKCKMPTKLNVMFEKDFIWCEEI